jgi:hypothetical protein
MGMGILQYKGNKLKRSAIGKKPWAYRIGTPQRFICLKSAIASHTSELATAKTLVEVLLKWVCFFFSTKAIN